MWIGPENQMTLVLIRHGATKSNKEHRYLGRMEENLMSDGMKELISYKSLSRYPDVDYLFSSPMKRCRESSFILYPNRPSFLIPEWEEMDFGEFEGKNYIELKEDVRYQTWIDSNGMLSFPKGESREEFIERCERGFHRMGKLLLEVVDQDKGEPKSVGIIAHGGTIMALLYRYYGGDYFDYQVTNGGGYECTLKRGSHEPKITDIKKI